MTYIKATLRNISFALPAALLTEILDGISPSPVPFSPSGVKGIVRYGESMITVFDSFGEQLPCARLLLILTMQRPLAVTADSVEGFIELDDEDIGNMKKQSFAYGAELLLFTNEESERDTD